MRMIFNFYIVSLFIFVSNVFAQDKCNVSKIVFNDGNTASIEYTNNPHAEDFSWGRGNPNGYYCVFNFSMKPLDEPNVPWWRSIKRALNGSLPKKTTSDGANVSYYEYLYPLSELWIDNFLRDNKRLPNEEEYQSFKKQFEIDFWNNKKNESAFQKKRYDELEPERLAKKRKDDEFTKLCKGIPALNLSSIEKYSSVLGVPPDSIKLNRVTLKLDIALLRCTGVFYTPKGAKNCDLVFNGKVAEINYCS